MASSGMISGVAGVLVAGGAFVALQAWTPPDFVLDVLDAKPSRHPTPRDPRHTLAVTPDPTGDSIVTEADVVAARTRPEGADREPGVELDLGSEGRSRLASYASSHAGDKLAVKVDDKLVYTRAASAFSGATSISLDATTPLENDNYELAARFGGALDPVDPYMLAAARLVPALLAGLVALAIVRIVTRR